MHPGQSGYGKLKLARYDFAATFQRIDDHIHARRSIRRERNLVRLGIDELRDAFSDRFAIGEPAIPMHVAVAHHLFVVAGSGFERCPRHRPRRRAVEIGEPFGNGKLFADVVPVDHVDDEDYTMQMADGSKTKPSEPVLLEAYSVVTL